MCVSQRVCMVSFPTSHTTTDTYIHISTQKLTYIILATKVSPVLPHKGPSRHRSNPPSCDLCCCSRSYGSDSHMFARGADGPVPHCRVTASDSEMDRKRDVRSWNAVKICIQICIQLQHGRVCWVLHVHIHT